MALPEFNHIHCSSRFDRTPASLEHDLDDWMDECSLITLTEVAKDSRASTMREKGWSYYNARRDTGADECAIGWSNEYWSRGWAGARKLTNTRFYNLVGTPCRPIYSATTMLKRRSSGHKLLVSVTHMPAHVEGPYHWRTSAYAWQARKKAYLEALRSWNTHISAQVRQRNPDAVMIVSDWNLSLKEDWVRDLLRDRFDGYKHAWQRFPTTGSSLTQEGGSTAWHPLGNSDHDRIIDGTLYKGLKVTREPNLMPRVRSSDHRPYKEGFRFAGKAERPDDDTASGDTHKGEAWWGFGDYAYDELYDVVREVEKT